LRGSFPAELVCDADRNLDTGGYRYRGAYDRAGRYRRGDSCTHDGCLFDAVTDNPVDAPGVCPDWASVAPRPMTPPVRPRR